MKSTSRILFCLLLSVTSHIALSAQAGLTVGEALDFWIYQHRT